MRRPDFDNPDLPLSELFHHWPACAGEFMSSLQIGAARPSDGTSANPDHPDWGATGTELLRLAGSALGPDGEMAGADRPNSREVSNILSAQTGETANAAGASDFLWIWGQFLDHAFFRFFPPF